jgi:hypothetical protein
VTPQEEIADLKRWNATLVRMHDDKVKDAKKLEHKARSSAFSAGIFGILIPFFLFLIVDKYGFDGELDAYLEDSKWAGFLAVGVFTACWKGMKYLAVERHKPKEDKKNG